MANQLMSRSDRTSDSELGMYLQQIPLLPRLNAEEERDLGERIRQNGCSASRERLVCSNLRLVVYAAKQYRGFGVPMADLVEAGNLGLLRAADRFDPSVGTRFSTYAMWWIKHAIIGALAENGSLVRCPAGQRRAQRSCQKARERLTAELGYEATSGEIALATGMSVVSVRAARSATRVATAASFDSDVAAASLPDASAHAPSEDASRREMTERLHTTVGGLPEGERSVVRLHFGLNGLAPLTVSRIAAELHIPADRVTRLLSKALTRMHKAMERPSMAGF